MQHTQGEYDYQQISPVFSVPLSSVEYPDQLHMVCEIPKGTDDKMEVKLDEEYQAIMHDLTAAGHIRKYKHGVMPWNYGMLPQTWEDDRHVWPETGLVGDGDPIDVIEIGSLVLSTEIARVKVLGILALIDQYETDWKVIAINTDDPRAKSIASKFLS